MITMNDYIVRGREIWRKPSFTVAIVLITIASAGAVWWLVYHSNYDGASNSQSTAVNGSALPPKPEVQLYKPLLPEQAVLENKQLPFSDAPVEKAMPLVLPTSQLLPIGRRNALDCLTSAIYYEAGNESRQGKQAVVQVILNRVRHPAFPKSICGVVYQGSERRTGCQFTFTCDGSLARRPARGSWEQARLIAIGAISGAVEPSVGMATHYHANYVLPYWASSLDKISQIGSHIFYRWKGSWGKRRAFSQVVQSDFQEVPTVALDMTAYDLDSESSVPVTPQKLSSNIIADDTTSDSGIVQSTQLAIAATSKMQADTTRSALAADEQQSKLKSD